MPPVIIPLEQVREKLINSPPHKPPLLNPPDHQLLMHLYTLNPLVAIFQQFRHAMINHDALSAGQALGGWAALLEPMAIVAAVFVLGFWVFNRAAPHIAEDL